MDTLAHADTRIERRTDVSALTHTRFILASLVSRDFKLKYRRSLLGVAWSILNPLLMMVVLSAVFSYMFRFNIENFPLYLILGTTLFTMMQNSSTTAMFSIIEASSLIKKVKVDKIVFPLEKVLFEILNFAISLIAVLLVMLWFRVFPDWNIVFLPLLLFYMVIFCTGLGMLLSALAVFFRDTVHLWGVLCTAWTYATPLFYPVDMLPEWMFRVMQFNPMYHYVTYFRDIAMWHVTPDLKINLLCLGFAVVQFVIGLVVFRKLQGRFILYV